MENLKRAKLTSEPVMRPPAFAPELTSMPISEGRDKSSKDATRTVNASATAHQHQPDEKRKQLQLEKEVARQVLESIKPPLKPEAFEKQMASLCKQVSDAKPVSLQILQQLDHHQQSLMKDHLEFLRANYHSTDK